MAQKNKLICLSQPWPLSVCFLPSHFHEPTSYQGHWFCLDETRQLWIYRRISDGFCWTSCKFCIKAPIARSLSSLLDVFYFHTTYYFAALWKKEKQAFFSESLIFYDLVCSAAPLNVLHNCKIPFTLVLKICHILSYWHITLTQWNAQKAEIVRLVLNG